MGRSKLPGEPLPDGFQWRSAAEYPPLPPDAIARINAVIDDSARCRRVAMAEAKTAPLRGAFGVSLEHEPLARHEPTTPRTHMDTSNGKLYDSKEAAHRAGARDADLITLVGSTRAIERTSRAVQRATASDDAKRKARRQAQKKARRANRA